MSDAKTWILTFLLMVEICSMSSIVIEYASSPVLQPGTQTRKGWFPERCMTRRLGRRRPHANVVGITLAVRVFPGSRGWRHFRDDWWPFDLWIFLFFFIQGPIDFRRLWRSKRSFDDDGLSRRPARRLGHWVGHGLLGGVVARLGSYSH
jgi:hypothetical protein